MIQFIELAHALKDGMAPYPGLPRPTITALLDHAQSRPRYQGQAEFYLDRRKTGVRCQVLGVR